ncbi:MULTISPECIES: phosphate ABC transporter substrate-binding protein [Desulfovibrio]|uniref:Phosphate-binding protein n=1 Tax=Desulfovibrio desulfuricans TaxID=876 RepID=A0AA94HQB7_DESDE|nr:MULTISPECIES: phosphate ABC transporter substrate-binding protein [Desulfovibrio]ATD81730.1 phosphate-binding protein [Desulfovibrio sp. G11]MDY0203892.1 phosphate ABC transporter substrate-binding protein [Desulfovibrio desulfuricans]SFW16718.1 phosphate transport system substrate-binding protein [Desulfovibrio desulfuricans]SPD34458.1 ABC transporter, phosphate transporting, phosphate binding component [Desulfovibrio sp. G11]
MKRIILAAVLLMCGLGTAFAASPSAPLDAFRGQKGVVDIAGGTAHIPVMKEAARQIMAVNPDVRITVAGGGSGVGVQKVGEGIVQIGNTGRALKPAEVEKYGLMTFPFAIDGVAVAVNPANRVTGLTKAQIKDVFSGKIANWKEVGGADAPISLYVREDGSGTRETFEERALDKGVAASKANVVSSNGAMKTAVSQDPNAIGYVGIGHLDNSIKGISIDGATPSQENAASGEYKVTRLLYMNTKGEPQGLTKAFVEYIFTPAGQDIVSGAGYIPYVKK